MNRMAIQIEELTQLTNAFIEELELGREGRTSSLPFIVHTLPSQPLVEDEETFQTLIVGGSVYQSALCKFSQGKLVIEQKTNGLLPVFKTKEEFLAFVDEMINPDIRTVALNFAYPLIPYFVNNKLDGRLVHGTKENVFAGMEGEAVGETIETYIQQKYNRQILVTVANDTICTLLSGLHTLTPDEAACGIVGTGMNFAFFLEDDKPVNLESANFDKFTLSEYGKKIDASSNFPGKGLFEKEISGAYLYQHFNLYLEENGETTQIGSSKELDMFVKTCDGTKDCEFATALIDRSAAYVAIQMAAIAKFKKRDMTFIMAGRLFWKGFNYKETVEKYVKQLVPYNISWMAVENCEIMGAAKLVG